MKILGIETSGAIGSVAICDGDAVIGELSFEKGMLHGKGLVPAVKAVFNKHGLKPYDIDLISVDAGPGSYTGLRVGITCTKTLSYILKKPVIDVTSLDTIAQNVKLKYEHICPILDARCKNVYTCIYKSASNGASSVNLWERVTDLLVMSPAELAEKVPKNAFVFGDGVSRYLEDFKMKEIQIGNDDMAIPKASVVAMLGRYFYEKGKRCEIDMLNPIYLRNPAEKAEKGDEKEKERKSKEKGDRFIY